MLIIDKDNSSYLVRPTLNKWVLSVGYSVPRKSKKGYVGSKGHSDKKEYLPNFEANAIEQFEIWKTEYYKKLQNEEILAFYLNLRPIISYYVTCPKCGKDAEILSWLMMFSSDEGSEMEIVCEHCGEGQDWIFNTVGKCYDTSFFFEREELNYKFAINVQNMTWEQWCQYSKEA